MPTIPADIKYIYSKSSDGVESNLLILFHGLGDTPENFIQFGKKMALPQTSLCALRGPCPIPFFDEGSGWFPAFNEYDAHELPLTDPRVLQGASESNRRISELIRSKFILDQSTPQTSVTAEKRFPPERIFLLGFSQGGTMALQVGLSGLQVPIGGIVSICGWMLPKGKGQSHVNTRVLILQGDSDPQLPTSHIPQKKEHIKKVADKIDVVVIPRKGHSMPQSKAEMTHIMSFFGSHLYLRNLKLEAMSDVILVSE